MECRTNNSAKNSPAELNPGSLRNEFVVNENPITALAKSGEKKGAFLLNEYVRASDRKSPLFKEAQRNVRAEI
jgi:hypothetical protein